MIEKDNTSNSSRPHQGLAAPSEALGEGRGAGGKLFKGIVVKTAMKDTATVSVDRFVKHPKYKKYLRRSKKYLVHDVGNTAKVGDKVTIRETRPISKRKHFMLVDRISSTKEPQV